MAGRPRLCRRFVPTSSWPGLLFTAAPSANAGQEFGRIKIVLDIKHKSVQYGHSQEVFRMMNSSIEAVIYPLRPETRDVADLTRKDRAGLVVKPGHDMQNRGRLLQRLLRSGHAPDETNHGLAPVLHT